MSTVFRDCSISHIAENKMSKRLAHLSKSLRDYRDSYSTGRGARLIGQPGNWSKNYKSSHANLLIEVDHLQTSHSIVCQFVRTKLNFG